MVLSDDTASVLRAVVALVNSDGEPDALTTVDDLASWFREHAYTGRHDGDEGELRRLRELRPQLRRLLTSTRDVAARAANEVLVDAGAVPQLVRHDGLDWHVHAVPGDAALHRRVAVETAMAMVDVIRADEMSRLSVCADERCEGVVLDLSRNRSRRFCSAACTNRNAVAAFRARARSAG